MFNRIIWVILKRTVLSRKYRGFSASRLSYADNSCDFSEYVKLHGKVSLSNVTVGRFSYIGSSQINNAEIGSFCSISTNVVIGQGSHPIHLMSTSPLFYSNKGQLNISFNDLQLEENKRTVIGNDVWIGYGAFIKDGVHIGNGAIIGAGAVVVKDVPEYAIVGGVPANLIRMRFTEDQIRKIKKLNWYSWDIAKLKENIGLFSKPFM